jgi:NTE family protein
LIFGASLRGISGLLLCVLFAGCATGYTGPLPIKSVDPEHGYRFLNTARGDNTNSLFVVLSFSGGGTRAAALSYGVLKYLAQTSIEWEGESRSLLDEVDVISAVSGGSVTAAYYALHRERIFKDFETRFLKQDAQGILMRRTFAPWNWPRLASPNFSTTDLLAEYLDKTLFSGATFGDITSRNQRPFVTLNATDVANGARFEFIQEQFDMICADLNSFPVARAVAASAAFPLLFNTVILPNRAGNCGYREASWVDFSLGKRQPSSRWYFHAKSLRSYQNAEVRPFIYLTDGGVSDYLGLRGPLDSVSMQDGAWNLSRRLGITDVRKVVFIIVSAARVSEISWKHRRGFPSFRLLMQAVTDIPVDRYAFETKELLRANLEQWAAEIRANRQKVDGSGEGPGIDFYLVDVDFEALQDATEREYLQRLPTRLSLPPEAVDRVRKSARTLLKADTDFSRLLRDIAEEQSEKPLDPLVQEPR